VMFILYFCLSTIHLLFWPRFGSPRFSIVKSVFFGVIFLSAIFAIVRPGNMFLHYLIFFPPLFLIMMGFLLGRDPDGLRLKLLYRFFFVVTCFVYPKQEQIDQIEPMMSGQTVIYRESDKIQVKL
jgi:hypothetical protein